MKLYRNGAWCYKYNIPLTPKILNILIKLIDNYTIFSECTVGGKSKTSGVPAIGLTGAIILGDITIGSNCIIGKNCFVVKDTPDNSVVAGISGKVMKSNIKPKNYY